MEAAPIYNARSKVQPHGQPWTAPSGGGGPVQRSPSSAHTASQRPTMRRKVATSPSISAHAPRHQQRRTTRRQGWERPQSRARRRDKLSRRGQRLRDSPKRRRGSSAHLRDDRASGDENGAAVQGVNAEGVSRCDTMRAAVHELASQVSEGDERRRFNLNLFKVCWLGAPWEADG